MTRFVAMTAILLGVIAIGAPAQAQNYPWCAYYGGRSGGASNCGFVSFEQCMATLNGIGGFCNLNTQYVPPPGPHRRTRHIRRHHH